MTRRPLFLVLFCVAFVVSSVAPAFAWAERVSAVGSCYSVAGITVPGNGTVHLYDAVNDGGICGIPSTSAMPHDDVQTLNIHGYSGSASNQARVCLKYWNGTSYSCGTWTALGTGVYGVTLNSSLWRTATNSYQHFPYVEVSRSTDDDAVYGFFLSN